MEKGLAQVMGIVDLSSSEEDGGDMTIQANEVELKDLYIDAQGKNGGNVFIGDKDDSFLAVEEIRVFEDATINTGSLDKGNGGQVILFADKAMDYRGSVLSQGGPKGGDGGFVEISSKDSFHFDGTVSLSAPQGEVGELLLDPTQVDISSSGPFTDSNIDVSALVTSLTAANVTVYGTQKVRVLSAINALDNSYLLTLKTDRTAGTSIDLNQAIRGDLGLNFDTGGDINLTNSSIIDVRDFKITKGIWNQIVNPLPSFR